MKLIAVAALVVILFSVGSQAFAREHDGPVFKPAIEPYSAVQAQGAPTLSAGNDEWEQTRPLPGADR